MVSGIREYSRKNRNTLANSSGAIGGPSPGRKGFRENQTVCNDSLDRSLGSSCDEMGFTGRKMLAVASVTERYCDRCLTVEKWRDRL
jgi:hypothetical protein